MHKPVQKHLVARDEAEWVKGIPRLGHAQVAVMSWQILNPSDAKVASHAIRQGMLNTTQGLYADRNTVPSQVLNAARKAAEFSGRITLDESKTLTVTPGLFGYKLPITSLHVDIGFQDKKAGLPAISTLYVVDGAIDAYFRLLPLAVLEPRFLHIADDFLNEWETEEHQATHGTALKPEYKSQFAKVSAGAGTLLAFPAAGSLERQIQPAAHQVETASEPRLTLPLYDIHFGKH